MRLCSDESASARSALAEATGAIDVLCGKGAPGTFNVLRQEMLDGVGDALGMVRRNIEDQIAAQAKQITELELKLAEAVGALTVLRGKEAPDSLNVPKQEILDSVGDALGMVRADFEDKLAVQAKTISELGIEARGGGRCDQCPARQGSAG